MIQVLNERLKSGLQSVEDFMMLTFQAIKCLFSRPFYWRDTLVQMDLMGVGSLSIVTLTGLFTGMVLTVQTSATLDEFGARSYVGHMVSLSMVRELGPVLTALMVAGRVGSGMAAELGSMVVTQQIDALRSLGTDPIRKLVVPRLAAGIVMLPILTILSDAVGMFGGYLASKFILRLSTALYWTSSLDAIELYDLFMGFSKPFVFGFIIVLVGCYQGLRTVGGTRGVGESTTRCVVVASTLVLGSDYFLNLLILRFIYP